MCCCRSNRSHCSLCYELISILMYVCVCVYSINWIRRTDYYIILNQTIERELDINFEGVCLNDELFLHYKTLTIQLKFTSWVKWKKKKTLRAAISQRCHRRGPTIHPKKKDEQNSHKTEIKTSHNCEKKKREVESGVLLGAVGKEKEKKRIHTQCKYVCQCKSAASLPYPLFWPPSLISRHHSMFVCFSWQWNGTKNDRQVEKVGTEGGSGRGWRLKTVEGDVAKVCCEERNGNDLKQKKSHPMD